MFHTSAGGGGASRGGNRQRFPAHLALGRRRREPPTHQHPRGGGGSPTFPDFPADDVFSHPSEQFRAPLCPDPDHFKEVAEELASPIPEARVQTGRHRSRGDCVCIGYLGRARRATK